MRFPDCCIKGKAQRGEWTVVVTHDARTINGIFCEYFTKVEINYMNIFVYKLFIIPNEWIKKRRKVDEVRYDKKGNTEESQPHES